MNNISIESDAVGESAQSKTESTTRAPAIPTKTRPTRGRRGLSRVKKTRRFTLFRGRRSSSSPPDAQTVETSPRESTDEDDATDEDTKESKQNDAPTKAADSGRHKNPPVNLPPHDAKRLSKDGASSRPKSILTVILLDATDLLAMDENGFSDPYCKLRLGLGSQKYKSKVKVKTLNPQWKEKFDFRVFEGDDTLNVEVWSRNYVTSDYHMGSCKVELGTLVPDKTYDLTLPLVDSGCGSIHLLLCLSGMAVNEVDECDSPQNDVAEESYGLISLLKMKPVTEVGCLKAKIGGVSELSVGENSSLFAALRVGNSEFRTDIVCTCGNATWNKTFYFNINDIHDDLEVSVICERKSCKNELVGKVLIPLLGLGANTTKLYALKDKHCLTKAKAGGVVNLECDLVYNPIRAGMRTFLPKEGRVMEEEGETLRSKVLISNIRRAMDVGSILQSTWSFIECLWSWEDKWLSALSFFFFVVSCFLAELWMVFPLLILLLLYGYMVVYVRGHHLWQIDSRRRSRHRDEDDEEESSTEELEGSDLEGEGDPTAEDQSKAGISRKFKQLQRVLLLLQTLLGQLADLGERMHNFCNWRVPWLCWLAITVLTVAMVIVYLIPLRYIILAWGVNKFTKRLRKPHHIPNQELLDFISRAPTYKQLHQGGEVPTIRVEKKRAKFPPISDKRS